MLCKKCGSKNPEEGKFCQSCGAKLEKAQPKERDPSTRSATRSSLGTGKKSKKKKIIIISVIVTLVVLIGGSIGGCALYRSIAGKSFDNEIKDIVKGSLEDGKELTEKFEELEDIENIGDLTDDTKELKDKIKEDADKVSDLKTKGGKQQVIKDKTKNYLDKYDEYLGIIGDFTEEYGEEESTTTEDQNSETSTTEDETTTTENDTEETVTGDETKEFGEKTDELKDAYNDLKDNSGGLIEDDFEEKITEMPTIIQNLILGKTLSDAEKAQQEALEKAKDEEEEQAELKAQRAQDLATATNIMTNFENSLKNNSSSGFYNNTTTEFQSSADGQAILTSIQGAGTGLTGYSITNSSRVNDNKYRFVVKETYQVGGSSSSETKTYEVVKSGTRWLVDNIL